MGNTVSSKTISVRQGIFFGILLLAAATVLAQGLSLKNGLARDDQAIFQTLEIQPENQSFLKTFQSLMTTMESSGKSGLLRPVSYFSFILDYKIWGLKPFGFHLTNLFLHFLAVVLVFFAAARVTENLTTKKGDLFVSFWAAVFFCVHPIQFETVGLIHNRSDILCLIFLLSSFLFFERNQTFLSILSYFLALLSKEAAVLFPLVLFVYELSCRVKQGEESSRLRKNLIHKIELFSVSLLAYLLVRLAVLSEIVQLKRLWGYYNFLPGEDFWWRPLMALKIFGQYAFLLLTSFDPFTFCADYFLSTAKSFLDSQVLWGAFVLAGLLLLVVALRKKWPVGIFCGAWFFLMYLPVSNLIPIGNMFSEHFMYIPSIGIFIAIATLFEKLIYGFHEKHYKLPRRGFTLALLFLLVAGWATASAIRNIYYKDDFHLWLYSAKHRLASPRVHLILGQYYAKSEQWTLAEASLQSALAKNPQYHPANMILGYVYKKQNLPKEAEKYFMTAAVVAREIEDTEAFKEAAAELRLLGVSPP